MTALPADLSVAALDQNLPCLRCGYNLRTLATNARCPECSTPIASSLDTNLLRYADPSWTSILALFMGLMFISACFELVNVYMTLLVTRYDALLDLSVVIDPIHSFTSPLFWLAAFLLGRPEPNRSSIFKSKSRSLMRIAALIALLWAIFYQSIASNLTMFPDYLTDLPIAQAIELLAIIFLFIYLLRLARQSGQPSLLRHTKIAMTAIISALCIWAFLDVTDSEWEESLDLLVRLLLAPVFLYQLYIFLRFRRTFRKSAKFAREHWHFCSPVPSASE